MKDNKKSKEKFKTKLKVRHLMFIFIGLVILFECTLFKQDPPEIDFVMSWVILSLISMLSISYVEMINRLKSSLLIRTKKSKLKSKGESYTRLKTKYIVLWLSRAGIFLFITLIALICKIIYLFLEQNAQEQEIMKLIDSIIIASFTLFSVLRTFLFFYSYEKDFFRQS